ncbi:hypothetical protein ACKS0A_06348 [Histoplasma ohiense]
MMRQADRTSLQSIISCNACNLQITNSVTSYSARSLGLSFINLQRERGGGGIKKASPSSID